MFERRVQINNILRHQKAGTFAEVNFLKRARLFNLFYFPILELILLVFNVIKAINASDILLEQVIQKIYQVTFYFEVEHTFEKPKLSLPKRERS